MIHYIQVRPLPPELHEWRQTIEGICREEGLDFHDVIYEMITYEKMSEIAAYGGFPTRYPHWRFGMEYDRLSKSHTYGLSKIYELVINTDPCYAYLLEGNALVDQKLVMAHVFGHATSSRTTSGLVAPIARWSIPWPTMPPGCAVSGSVWGDDGRGVHRHLPEPRESHRPAPALHRAAAAGGEEAQGRPAR
jgi:hypothetical protein